jgi:hypothetical protein
MDIEQSHVDLRTLEQLQSLPTVPSLGHLESATDKTLANHSAKGRVVVGYQ